MVVSQTDTQYGIPPMQDEVNDLFKRYERLTNEALANEPDLDALGNLYTDEFIASAPGGVRTGQKDDEFEKMLTSGFAYNREIGTQRMNVTDVKLEPIDDMHALANVDWRATYDIEETTKNIEFTNAYLVRVENGEAKVFGWITGDEQAELREHGIID